MVEVDVVVVVHADKKTKNKHYLKVLVVVLSFSSDLPENAKKMLLGGDVNKKRWSCTRQIRTKRSENVLLLKLLRKYGFDSW